MSKDLGWLIVTDLNDCIRGIDLETKKVYTLSGSLNGKNGHKDGDDNKTLFNFPYGLTEVGHGTFLVTESDNHSIRQIHLEPILAPKK